MSQQLVKKGANGGYSNVMPKSWIEAIKDKNTGKTLVEILQSFNMYFLSYDGNSTSTRCLVPTILRKKGLWITYVKYDGNVYTEWYAADEIDDTSWGDSSNWRVGNNTLVGDITISANGNWVINGTETEFKAVGEKGNTPLVRFGSNNKFQVSYNNGEKWLDISGIITNNLRIKKYIGINEALPTSGVEEGTIYMKGPYYAEGDTLNNNPIYRMWIYAWKGDTLAWQDNGEFTSIAAGVVQETGDSETEVMSQASLTKKTVLEVKGIYSGKQAAINDGLTVGDRFIYYQTNSKEIATFITATDVSYCPIEEDGILIIDGLFIKLVSNELKIVGLSGIINLDGISTYPETNGTFRYIGGSIYYRFKNVTSNWQIKYLPLEDTSTSKFIYEGNYYELIDGQLKRTLNISIKQSVRLEDFTAGKYWDFRENQPVLNSSSVDSNCALVNPVVLSEGDCIVINTSTQNKNVAVAAIADKNNNILSRYYSSNDGKTFFVYAPENAKYLYLNSNFNYSDFICSVNPNIIKDIILSQNTNRGVVLENFQLQKYWDISEGNVVQLATSTIDTNACSRNPIPIKEGDVVFLRCSTFNKNLPVVGISNEEGKIIKIYNSDFDDKQLIFVAPKSSKYLYINCVFTYDQFMFSINPPLLSEYIRTQNTFNLLSFNKNVDFGEPINKTYKGLQSDYSFGSKDTKASDIYNAFENLVDEKYFTKASIGTASDGSEMFAYFYSARRVNIDEDVTRVSRKPLKIIIVCGQHGFEKSSIYGTYYFFKDLLNNYKNNEFLNYVRNNIDFVIIPCANPYGVDNFNYLNANGVNLNRNWAIKNWAKSSDTPGDSQYGGESAGDQIEVQNISSVLRQNTDAVLVIDYHTNGNGTVTNNKSLNWISYPIPDDEYFKHIIEVSKHHIKNITSYYETEYLSKLDSSDDMCGYITGENINSVGYLDAYSKEQGFISLTFEGFNGFPNESAAFSSLTKKANSELLGNFIKSFCLEYSKY